MAKIDRLGWADGMSFNAYGVRVGVRVNEPAILSDLIARLPPGSKPASFQVVDHLYSIIFGEAKTDSKVRRLSLAYRSEEHTSELQSRLHLVCRLLLEKKKKFAHSASLSHTQLPVLLDFLVAFALIGDRGVSVQADLLLVRGHRAAARPIAAPGASEC